MICREGLSHIIQFVVSRKAWKPISLSRGGPKITHLGFTNDLFIFAKAFMNEVEVINECLHIFYASLRQKLNHEKMKIYVSKIIGKYLGVPLQRSQVNANSFIYVTVRLMQKLST